MVQARAFPTEEERMLFVYMAGYKACEAKYAAAYTAAQNLLCNSDADADGGSACMAEDARTGNS